MNSALDFLQKSTTFHIGKFSLPFSVLQAIAIVFLIFLLILTLAQVRHHYVNWSFKGALFGIFFGFILALILEGFLLIKGRTAITEVLGWKNAPRPLQVALDLGKGKLVQVLGAYDQIPESSHALQVLQSLNPEDRKKIKVLLCQP